MSNIEQESGSDRAFQAYIAFNAFKRHFETKSYDYIKYHGKIPIKYETFAKRRDKYVFFKLSRNRDFKNVILANFVALHGKKLWINDIVSDVGNTIYNEWQARVQSLSYRFEQDIRSFDRPFDDTIRVNNDDSVRLIDLYHDGKIMIETLIIIDDLCNVTEYWRSHMKSTFLIESLLTVIDKYKPFVRYDRVKFRDLILTHCE